MAVANFSDDSVTVRLCLDDGTFGQSGTYPVGRNPISIRYADFDRDGEDDLVTANSGTNTVSVLVNLGVGANFQSATNFVVGSTASPTPQDVNVADINRDGLQDLVVANYGETNVSVLLNLGAAVFGPPSNHTVGRGPSSVIATDLNQDAFLDIVTANTIDGTLTILPGKTGGTFGAAQTITLYPGGDPQPVYVCSADLNHDGVLDLVVANSLSNNITILLGVTGVGGWSVQSQSALAAGNHPTSLSVRDFNYDGIPDIAVVNRDDNNIQVYFGVGNGTFDSQGVFSVGSSPRDIAGSNFNGDRSTDLAVVNFNDNNVSVLLFSGPLAYGFSQNVNEDTPTAVYLRGSLLGGGPLEYFTNSAPTHGLLTGSGTNRLYLPDTNYFGPDGFSFYTVDTNAALTSAVATVSIQVLPVNESPGFSLTTNVVTVLEDSATTNLPGFADNFVTGPTNESGQTVAFIVTTPSNAFFSLRPNISPSGTLAFAPAKNKVGTVPVTVTMRDSGGTSRGGNNLSIPKAFNIVITPHPLKPHKGGYSGLFYGTNGVVAHPSSGFFTFYMSAYGAFSGKWIGKEGGYRFSGEFDLSGRAQTFVSRNDTTLFLDLQLDLTNGTDKVTGTVTDNQFVWSTLLGDRATFSAVTNPAPQAGLYTLAIPGSVNPTNAPGGDGYATVSVSTKGIVKATGKLSDGTVFSQSVSISKYGEWPFYVSLLAGQGSVLGWLTFTNLPASSLEGDVSWIKPATFGKYYPNGFTNVSAAIGSTYTPPGSGLRVLETTNNVFTISGGNVEGALFDLSTLAANNLVSVSDVIVLQLTKPAIGYMSWLLRSPVAAFRKDYYGVALQQQREARGFFLGTNLSGAFLLSPND